MIDTGAAEEVTFAAAAGSGETETGGLVIDIVPTAGGNSDDAHASDNIGHWYGWHHADLG